MDNELNNLNDDNKSENNNDLLENNNQENQINYKSNKWKKILIGIIVLIVIFITALTIYVFVINKNANKDNIGQGNNSNVEDNNQNVNDDEHGNNDNIEDNIQNINYRMEKILDSLGIEHTAKSLIETEKYYIFEVPCDDNTYNKKYVFYDKNGKDVTKQVFGTSDISYIGGISSYDKNDILLVKTSREHCGLYDKNFNEIVKIGNQVIERTHSENYFVVGDLIDSQPSMSERLENVGVYDKSGKLVIPREYERIFLIDVQNYSLNSDNKTLFYARKNDKYGIIDEKNNVIIPFEYEVGSYKVSIDLGQVFKTNEYFFVLYKDGKTGMVDSNNNVIINFQNDRLYYRLSYSKYANAVIEEDDKNNKINVYNLNGELKKTIDLGNDLQIERSVKYYKFDTLDYVFYDDKYIYLLNSNLKFEKYIKPYKYMQWGYPITYYASSSIYFTRNDDEIKIKIYNAKDNTLMYKDAFYLINEIASQYIPAYFLCKTKTGDNSYSKCGIIGYDGKIISDFNYSTINNNDSMLYNLLFKNEVILFKYEHNPVDGGGKYYMEKNNIGSIDGSCMINDRMYEMENNIVITYEGNTRSVYNSSCNLILNSVDNAYSLNDDLVMSNHKIYSSKDGKQVNIGNDDKAVITSGVIGRTLNDEPIVSTDKGIYKIVKE